jgi:calcium-dependent protein kinase
VPFSSNHWWAISKRNTFSKRNLEVEDTVLFTSPKINRLVSNNMSANHFVGEKVAIKAM